MRERYLEVTFRKGKALAAYLYLPRADGEKSVRTEEAAPGILVDYGRSGQPIGLEITDPGRVTAADVNEVLDRLGLQRIPPEELEPVRTA